LLLLLIGHGCDCVGLEELVLGLVFGLVADWIVCWVDEGC
jgi:hypothetical protein